MKNKSPSHEHQYRPDRLLSELATRLQIYSDAELAKVLRVTKSVVREIRQSTLPIGGSMLMWMSEVSAIGIDELRSMMGDRRARIRIGRSLALA